MNVPVQPHVTTTQRHLPFECVALVLQGGGALKTSARQARKRLR
jgi:NTE family protein